MGKDTLSPCFPRCTISDMIRNACPEKSSTSQNTCAHLTVHANWDVLFKLHYEFDTEHFMDRSEAGHVPLCRGIYGRDMQCDQIILVLLFPVFW